MNQQLDHYDILIEAFAVASLGESTCPAHYTEQEKKGFDKALAFFQERNVFADTQARVEAFKAIDQLLIEEAAKAE